MTARDVLALGLTFVGCATLVIAQSGVDRSRRAPPDDASSRSAADTAGTYVGSEACQSCHEDSYAAWKRSLHVQMTAPIERAAVSGDFAPGAPMTQHGRTYGMGATAGRYSISVAQGRGQPETFEAHYTLGAKRFQGYLSRLPDGRLYVLPVFWNVEWKRWLDWKEIAPVPDSNGDVRQIWNINCFNCHATNIERNFDAGTRTYATTATEMGVGCEACHGPGRAHVDRATAWQADPSTRPALDSRDSPGGLSAQLEIFSARTAEPRQVYDMCAYCHGNKTNYLTGFTPGARLEDYAQLALISDPVPDTDPQGEFWPDGRPSRFNRPQALTLSGCFRSGQLTCTSCHEAHGSPSDHSLKVGLADSDRLCTQCHRELESGPALSRHTHHQPGSPGSRCVQCHMSDVNWRLLTRRRDHTFAPPVPELTARYGIPNACTTCHEDGSPEWAAAAMDGWYADTARRLDALAVADAIYAGGSRDRRALVRLSALAVSQDRGALLRASAAGFIGRLVPSAGALPSGVVNALIGASTDPEPMVRVAAARSLGSIGAEQPGAPRVAAALTTRLTDAARTVRISAAESLLYIGITDRDGASAEALRLAQEEYAESLRAFPDMASHQTSLGWLRASQGRTADAVSALKVALTLDPTDARASVYLGIIAAREGRFDEAIALWRAARRLNPRYPNIDRLIAEATQRRSGAAPPKP